MASQSYAALLQAAGVDAAAVEIADAAHRSIIGRGGNDGFEEACEAMEGFLARVLE